MSNENSVHELDNLFAAYAKKAEDEAKQASFHSGSTPREYEEIKYTGLEQGVPSVLRVVGGPYDSNLDDFTARTVNISRIVGDDGKRFRVITPSFNENPNYILNRIISAVTKPKWVNKEKTFPVQEQFPEIYNIIDKNGIKKGDPQYNFDKGWRGKQVFIMNVIDRSQMDWHRAHKHTMLLAKSVNIGKNGGEFPDEGISAFACGPQFTQLFKRYGSWEKYDIAITKTGEKSKAFDIGNATRTPEIAEDKESLVSQETSLTEEEKSWERYNIAKLFRVTTSTKIYNRLKGTIARIDAALKTNFLEELKAEVEEEKIRFDEMYGRNEDTNEDTSTTDTDKDKDNPPFDVEVTDRPSTSHRTRTVVSSPNKVWSILPFADSLSDEMKKRIKSVSKLDDKNHYHIEWDYPEEDLAECPVCLTVAPFECDTCPGCGESFVG